MARMRLERDAIWKGASLRTVIIGLRLLRNIGLCTARLRSSTKKKNTGIKVEMNIWRRFAS